MKPPKEAIRKIQWWLKSRFNRAFKELGDKLQHGDQEDYTDCGILAANTAACELFEDEEIWTPKRKVLERVTWFNKLVEKHISEVNIIVYTLCKPILTHIQVNKHAIPSVAYGPIFPTRTQADDNTDGLPKSLAHLLNKSPDQHSNNNTLDPKLKPNESCIVPQPAKDVSLPSAPDGSSLDKRSGELGQIHPFFIGDHDMDMDEQGKANLGVNEKKRPLTPESNKDEQPKSKVGKLVHLPLNQASYHRGHLGQSKSTIWAHLQNEKYERGKLNAADSFLARFTTKILALDRYAVIVDSKTVRHIKCGKHLTMKAPFDIGNFRSHVLKCAGPPKSAKLSGAGMLPFDAYFKNNTSHEVAQPKEPCPGLDETVYPEIAAYLNRTGARGGGASSVTVIAEEMWKAVCTTFGCSQEGCHDCPTT